MVGRFVINFFLSLLGFAKYCPMKLVLLLGGVLGTKYNSEMVGLTN